MRIIGGQWRGRLLPVPDRPGLRPSPDRVRETLFNWLANDIQQLTVLDMFAGTGALGFEALSRGAASAVLWESDAVAAKALQSSAQTLAIEDQRCEIRRCDAMAALAQNQRRFDLVFVDPPFQAELWDQVLEALPIHLNPAHRVYVEAPRSWAGPQDARWRVLKEKTAADVVFRLLDYSD